MYLFRDVFIYKTTAAGTAVIVVTDLIGNKPSFRGSRNKLSRGGWGSKEADKPRYQRRYVLKLGAAA